MAIKRLPMQVNVDPSGIHFWHRINGECLPLSRALDQLLSPNTKVAGPCLASYDPLRSNRKTDFVPIIPRKNPRIIRWEVYSILRLASVPVATRTRRAPIPVDDFRVVRPLLHQCDQLPISERVLDSAIKDCEILGKRCARNGDWNLRRDW